MLHPDRRTSNSKKDILDAAQRVAAREGPAHVTLDAVARECGLSKGGVLYNFPSKDALISGMLERLIGTIRLTIEQHREARKGQPNPTLRAVVEASKFTDEFDPNVQMAILAAAAQNPELLEPLREEFAEQYANIQQEAEDPDLAMVLWAATHGLMFQTLLGIAPFPAERQNELIDRLLAHIEKSAR